MPFPNQDYSKRDYLLPEGCKDLAEAIQREQETDPRTTTEPPITQRVKLPEKVSVKFLAEISGQSLIAIAALMREWRIIVDVNRSVDFEDAAKILRRYGIGADRAA